MKRAAHSPAIDAGSVRAQLRRVLASQEFAASERICRFLNLAVTETLAGRSGDLKEYRIGVDVFDRLESFNPAIDPIVRVEARRLRTKLGKYYEEEGRADAILIELPKGGYVPAFRRRDVAPPQQTAPARLAVMPFVDLTGSPEGAYLADGLTWELIHDLTRLRDLAVVAWNSSAQLGAERQPDIDLVREKLRVDFVLVGSARRFGDSLYVMAQLIDARSGVYLWSERYERRIEDAADIQREISARIIASLQVRLRRGEAAPGTAAYNPEAYQLYLRGRGQWNLRTEAGLRDALESFRAAAKIDPACAVAYAGMADSYALLAEYGLERLGPAMSEAKACTLRALEIDPSLGEAHSTLGFLLSMHEWNWEAGEAHYRRALDLNPGYATAHHWFSCDYLAVLGRLDEAFEEIEIALALDPLSPIIQEGKGFLLLLARRYDEAEAHIRSVQKSNPDYYRASAALGRLYVQQRRYAEAVDALVEACAAAAGTMPTVYGALGQAYGLAGQTEDAERVLGALEQLRRDRRAPATTLALVNAGLARRDEAIRWLSEGLDGRETSAMLIGIHPAYDSLRDHPDFSALVNRLGLPQSRQAQTGP